MSALETGLLIAGIVLIASVLRKILSVGDGTWFSRKPVVRTHDWMSPDDRATVIAFHAIKDQPRKLRAGQSRRPL